jgi:hypothetical protein
MGQFAGVQTSFCVMMPNDPTIWTAANLPSGHPAAHGQPLPAGYDEGGKPQASENGVHPGLPALFGLQALQNVHSTETTIVSGLVWTTLVIL